MSSLVETIAFIFGLVALGYAAGWFGLLKQQTGDALSDFAVSVAVPLLLFRTMAGADFGGSLPLGLWVSYFTAVAVTWLAGHLVIVHAFGREKRAAVVGGLASSFSNLVLLGIPFMLGVYGQPGFEVLSLIVSIHLPIMIGTSILLFGWLGEGEEARGLAGAAADFARSLASSPLIIGIAAGLLWRAAGIGMPSLMERLVDALADVAGPVALFAMGLGLRRYGITGNVRPALAVAGLKLFLMPGIALVMAKLMGLPPMSAKVVVAAASLPSGVNPYLIAMRFGTGQAISSNAMSLGTAAAVLTTAFWLAVAQWVIG
ncbi:AEC family transporter [Chelativorans intermedius]|uniref:AEC family transporter n=1 Tax=Chelativorans intermedius TaxID=515947 RepID=A0ABV6D400_9HYPH|nr:AEC family transporter [Chelativorans intermedius]MCT8997051.1 AEC family transporter [Chelativorans intermedius]